MAEKKITKRDMFAELKVMAETAGRDDLVEFINHEVELLAKKSSKRVKPENEEMYKEVITALATFDKPVTVSEILASGMLDIAKYSNQRIAALLKKGIENDEVVKVTDKKKSLFSIKSEKYLTGWVKFPSLI
jgi:hypothetical protein